jgi:cyclic-di-AMP phosphodiesterase PgpH
MKLGNVEKNFYPSWTRRIKTHVHTSGFWGRVGLVSILCLFLFFSFYFRTPQIETLKVGAIANRFIINQADFNYHDKTATEHQRQRAKAGIGPIYRLKEQQSFLIAEAIKERIVHDTSWKEIFPNAESFLICSILDRLIDEALLVRFTDAVTLKKVPKDAQPIYWVAASNRLPQGFWKKIASQIQTEHTEILGFCVEKLETTQQELYEDERLENAIRNAAAEAISPVYIPYKAGQTLVASGEEITDRHNDILQNMKQTLGKEKEYTEVKNIVSDLLIILLITAVGAGYVRMYYPDIYFSLNKIALLIFVLCATIVFGKGIEYFLAAMGGSWKESLRYPSVYMLSTILITILLNRTIAGICLLFLLLLSWDFFGFQGQRFALINIVASIASIRFCHKMYRRQIFTGGLKVWLVVAPLLIAFQVADKELSVFFIMRDLFANLAFISIITLIVIALLPFIEKAFGVLTDMALTEYLDPNHELMRRLSSEAPGTYQHSLVVGHVAEAAARSIGAHELFCRVATLYHDIGKLYHPQYFTENQMGGFNIHHLLTPKESAKVIIAHVEEGVAIAKKYRLPQQFIDIIQEHHGDTLVYCFYARELEQQDNDTEKVSQGNFRYKGPKPKSKESAIVMIADCVEAASRSLEGATEHSIEVMIDKIIKDKLFDGQFEECRLTFEELGRVKKAMVKALIVTHHVRVKYGSSKEQTSLAHS